MTSVARRHDDSGEYSDGSQDIEHNNSGNDVVQQESDYESDRSDSEHSDRDPDSQETERRVDDDEDRSNPQYIPKRGTFYEHDDRTAASGEETTTTASEAPSEKEPDPLQERRRAPRKSEQLNKWSHDKYNENEQNPKSREELVAIYGYDIRNEDAPPHARRNRRYGRGPNKYTRTWEDEEAYRRQAGAPPPVRKLPNPEDFPELDPAARRNSRRPVGPRTPRPRSTSQPPPAEPEDAPRTPELQRNSSVKARGRPAAPPRAGHKGSPVMGRQERKQPPKDKMPNIENLTITANANSNSTGPRKVSAAVAQQRPVPTDQGRKKPMTNNQPPPPAQGKPQPRGEQKPQPQNQQPAGGAESRGGSKRYSSLRQRPLADSYTPQTQQPSPTTQQPPTTQQQPPTTQQSQQPPREHRYNTGSAGGAAEFPAAASVPPHMLPHQQQIRMMEQQQQLVSHPHLPQIHNLPPAPHPIVPAQIQPSQGYAPPAMMPTQFMQGGAGAVYGSGPLYQQPPAPYQHPQMYTPHHNYATQAGGVTYYNCAEQEPPAVPRTQRRPTAAIPIVRPTHDRPANSTEKDNIDRIVENMFVRKPWPTTPSSDSKDKPQSERSSQEPAGKDSQPNSLTSSSISTDSRPSEAREEKGKEDEAPQQKEEDTREEPPASDA